MLNQSLRKVEFLEDSFLRQLVLEELCENTKLDLILVSEEHFINNFSEHLGSCDQCNHKQHFGAKF